MFRRTLVGLVLVLAMTTSARAQLVVIDPANLYQTVLIAERTWQHYQELRRQYETILRMSRGLGNMEGYRIPTIGITTHDPSRWEYGRPWIQALNSGDATGAAYLSTALPLLRPTTTPARMTAAARRTLERQYATIEIADSVAMMAGHQVALSRGYHGRLQTAVNALQDDVLNGLLRYHEMTAILDKVAAGELLGRRQDMASNQLLSHALEQLLSRSKRQRDTEAATINMQLTTWRDGQRGESSVRRGHRRCAANVASALRPSRKEVIMRRALLALALCAALSVESLPRRSASHDPAVTARNSVDRRREGVPARHRAAAAQPAATDGAAPEPVHQLGEVRARGSASLAHARRRLPVHAGVQRCPDLWRPCWRRLSGGESSGRGRHGLCWGGLLPPLAAS